MSRPDDRFILRWPWRDLDAMCGGMPAGGRPVYVVGFSGMGKSCFLNSALLLWAEQGIRVDVLPLETSPDRFKMNIAALEAGLDPGLIASGDYLLLPDAERLRAETTAAHRLCEKRLFWQEDLSAWPPPPVGSEWRIATSLNPLRINDATGMDIERLRGAFELAQERGTQVLCLDHVDHLTEAQDTFASTTIINRTAQRLAMETGIVTILMSQANNDALKGNADHLAKFAPLRETSVWMGGLKRQLGSMMLGIFRPLRDPEPSESNEDFLGKIKKAKAGVEAPSTVLRKGAFGVSLMKSENYGSREGQRTILGWSRGRIVDYVQLPHSLR